VLIPWRFSNSICGWMAMAYVPLRGQFLTGAIVVFLVWGLFAVRTLTGPLIGAP
jgi:hypothetical protein